MKLPHRWSKRSAAGARCIVDPAKYPKPFTAKGRSRQHHEQAPAPRPVSIRGQPIAVVLDFVQPISG